MEHYGHDRPAVFRLAVIPTERSEVKSVRGAGAEGKILAGYKGMTNHTLVL